ncbi:MAG: ABC transporter permease, partial [Chloroflexi bacterium]|nr:ABC transporter permease [Chloroflexota bacterium]
MNRRPVDDPTAQETAPAAPPGPARPAPRLDAAAWLTRLARWETLLLALLVGVVIYNAQLSPYFLNTDNLLDDTSNFMEIGVIALPMTLIIIAGHIDLSVGSNAALCSVVFATLWQHGWNVWLACLAALLVGLVAGLANGVIITRIGLPSLIVTLGTFALYRGLANGILGSGEISGFPTSFSGIDLRYLPGTHIPAPLVIFVVLALLIGLLLHGTVLGRYIFAIGNNEQASRFSGVAVDRVVLILFSLSGFLSALAGLVLTSRLVTSRSDLATNFELSAITAAVLGGANIFGGEGSIPGTVIALFIIGLL